MPSSNTSEHEQELQESENEIQPRSQSTSVAPAPVQQTTGQISRRRHVARVAYTCVRCGKQFVTKQHAVKHLKTITPCRANHPIELTEEVKECILTRQFGVEDIPRIIAEQNEYQARKNAELEFLFSNYPIISSFSVVEKMDILTKEDGMNLDKTVLRNMESSMGMYRNMLDKKTFSPGEMMLYNPHLHPDFVIDIMTDSLNKIDVENGNKYEGIYNMSAFMNIEDYSVDFLKSSESNVVWTKLSIPEFSFLMMNRCASLFESYVSYLMRAYHNPGVSMKFKEIIEYRLIDVLGMVYVFHSRFEIISKKNWVIMRMKKEDVQALGIDPDGKSISEQLTKMILPSLKKITKTFAMLMHKRLEDKLLNNTERLNKYFLSKYRKPEFYNMIMRKLSEKKEKLKDELKQREGTAYPVRHQHFEVYEKPILDDDDFQTANPVIRIK